MANDFSSPPPTPCSSSRATAPTVFAWGSEPTLGPVRPRLAGWVACPECRLELPHDPTRPCPSRPSRKRPSGCRPSRAGKTRLHCGRIATARSRRRCSARAGRRGRCTGSAAAQAPGTAAAGRAGAPRQPACAHRLAQRRLTASLQRRSARGGRLARIAAGGVIWRRGGGVRWKGHRRRSDPGLQVNSSPVTRCPDNAGAVLALAWGPLV
jgi:hypothetical protein